MSEWTVRLLVELKVTGGDDYNEVVAWGDIHAGHIHELLSDRHWRVRSVQFRDATKEVLDG